jgi:hypothetical protein
MQASNPCTSKMKENLNNEKYGKNKKVCPKNFSGGSKRVGILYL